MSYCRFRADGSDVYVIASSRDYYAGGSNVGKPCWVCYCDPIFVCDTRLEMLTHLRKHKEKGDKVPKYAIKRLRREIRDEMAELR